MRVDPNAFATVATLGFIAVVATAGANMAPDASTSLAIVGVAVLAGVVVAVRAVHRAVGSLNGERLATSLPEEMRATIEAPGLALLATPPPIARTDDVHDAHDKRLAVDACPRCDGRLALPAGAFQQRDCAQGCGALVLDSERLLVDRAALDLEVVRALVREQGVKKGVCPSCSSTMHEGRLRGLVVDLCLSCGALWLDTQELARLSREDAFGGNG